MAQIIAKVDFFSPIWENGELEKEINKQQSKTKLFEWFKDSFSCEPENVDLELNFDDVITENKDYKLFYGDWGMNEVIYLVKL